MRPGISGLQPGHRVALGEDDLECGYGYPQQEIDPRQRAAQGECDHENSPIQTASADVFCNCCVNRAPICRPQLIYMRHLLIPSERRASSIAAVDGRNLRIL